MSCTEDLCGHRAYSHPLHSLDHTCDIDANELKFGFTLDMSAAQRKAFEEELASRLVEVNDGLEEETAKLIAESNSRGCAFHFAQSAERVSKLRQVISEDDSDAFKRDTNALLGLRKSDEFSQAVASILKKYPRAKSWVAWYAHARSRQRRLFHGDFAFCFVFFWRGWGWGCFQKLERQKIICADRLCFVVLPVRWVSEERAKYLFPARKLMSDDQWAALSTTTNAQENMGRQLKYSAKKPSGLTDMQALDHSFRFVKTMEADAAIAATGRLAPTVSSA